MDVKINGEAFLVKGEAIRVGNACVRVEDGKVFFRARYTLIDFASGDEIGLYGHMRFIELKPGEQIVLTQRGE